MVLDATIVNVALPSMQRDLGFSQANLAWVVDAYMIAFGSFLLPAGRLGDMLGRKRMFLIGLVAFTLASVACGLAGDQVTLILARFVQGLGGAVASAAVLALLVTEFPQPRERAIAMSVYTFIISSGGSIGLLAGGALTQGVSWHWIFFINVPIGVVALLLGRILISETERLPNTGRVDLAGPVLVTAALMTGVYAIVKATDYGWGSAHTLGFGAVAVALLAGFVVRQATAANPLLPLRVFRSRNLSGANAVQMLMLAGMLGVFFLGALYLQRVLAFGPLAIGLAFMPAALGISVLSLNISPRLSVRFGAREVLLGGLVLAAAGLALLVRVPVDGHYLVDMMPGMLLIGVGVGLSFPPLMTLAMAGVAPADSGLASGLVNTSAQVGGALGLAVLATLASGRTDALLAAGVENAAALTGGYQLAFGISSALVVAAIGVGALVLRREGATDELEDLDPEPEDEEAAA